MEGRNRVIYENQPTQGRSFEKTFHFIDNHINILQYYKKHLH